MDLIELHCYTTTLKSLTYSKLSSILHLLMMLGKRALIAISGPRQTVGWRLPNASHTAKVRANATSFAQRHQSTLIEIREDCLKPESVADYQKAAARTVALSQAHLPLRFFSYPETGGPLHVATHPYYYQDGHEERLARSAALEKEPAWQSHVAECGPFIRTQTSTSYVEASSVVNDFPGVQGLSPTRATEEIKSSEEKTPTTDCILELRRYKLQLGYDTVPRFLEYYQTGLSSKLDTLDSTTSLVSVVYTDVGPLNHVMEIWRHGGGFAAMEASRVNARAAPAWKTAIGEIAHLAVEFTTTIHRPTHFSPIR